MKRSLSMPRMASNDSTTVGTVHSTGKPERRAGMMTIHRVEVYAHGLFARRARELTASVVLIGAVCLPTPAWAQFINCTNGSQTCTNSSVTNPVGIGTTSPSQALDIFNGRAVLTAA